MRAATPGAHGLPLSTGHEIEVVRAASQAELAAALEIRYRVFAEEQGVADLRVSDPDDPRSVIALATFDLHGAPSPVSTGRLTPPLTRGEPALIAWVATIPEARGQGAGGAVIRYLLAAADSAGTREIALAAQLRAEAFYLRLGFEQAGPIYDVRGIPHRRMIRPG